MFDYSHLQALAAIVREGSFANAARALHLTQSAVSQRLKALEDRVGQLLLVRETPPRPTRLGRLLIQHMEQVMVLEQEVDDIFVGLHSEEFFTLPVGVNADSLATWFLESVTPALAGKRTLLELVIYDEDYTQELLRRGEVVGCVSANASAPQGCDSAFLGVMRYRCVATKQFVKKYLSEGLSSKTIAQAPAIIFSTKDDLHLQFLEREYSWRSQAFPAHIVPSSEGFLDMVLRGLAYGLVPEFQIKQHLKRGRLVDLSPKKYVDVKLYWHYWRYQTDHGRLLTSTLKERSTKLFG